MAKRKTPSARRRGDVDFELSPSSEYFLYGKGGSDEYAREIRRIKTQLREAIYGDYYDYEQEAEDKKFKINVSALIIFILSVAALIVTLIGKIASVGSIFHVAQDKDGITLIMDCINAFSGAQTANMGFYIGLFALIYTVVDVLMIIGSALIIRKRGTGKLMRLSTVVAFIVCVAAVATEIADMQTVPVGIMILTVSAFLQVIAAAAGGKKKRR